MYHCSIEPPVGRRLVDPTEELAGAGRPQRVERLPHRHLDVLGGDLVGRPIAGRPARGARSSGRGTPARTPAGRARRRARETDRRCTCAIGVVEPTVGHRGRRSPEPMSPTASQICSLLSVCPAAQSSLHLSWRRCASPGSSSGSTTRSRSTTLTLDVPARSCFGLVGPNGSGKSTTLRSVIGLVRPDAGVDRSVRARHRHRRACGAAHDRRRARSAPAVRAADRPRVPGDDGRAAPDGAATSPRERTDELLDTLQLADDADRQIAGYSHGMRKKTALAAAVLHRPRLLLLDEPFEGVDPLSARTMRAMLDRFRAGGGTVVLSSHVMDLVERLCDHVGVIHRGRVVASGPDRRAAQRPTTRGRLHRRRRGVRVRPRRARLAGLSDAPPLVHAFVRLRWRLLRGAIRHGGAEQVGAVASLRRIGHGRHRRRRGRAASARTNERARRRPVGDLLHGVRDRHARASASSPASPSRSIRASLAAEPLTATANGRVGLLAASAFGPPGLAGIAIAIGLAVGMTTDARRRSRSRCSPALSWLLSLLLVARTATNLLALLHSQFPRLGQITAGSVRAALLRRLPVRPGRCCGGSTPTTGASIAELARADTTRADRPGAR